MGCVRPFVLMATHELLQGFLRLPVPMPPKCDSGKMKHVISTHKSASSRVKWTLDVGWFEVGWFEVAVIEVAVIDWRSNVSFC